jgi:hypothetical protein
MLQRSSSAVRASPAVRVSDRGIRRQGKIQEYLGFIYEHQRGGLDVESAATARKGHNGDVVARVQGGKH